MKKAILWVAMATLATTGCSKTDSLDRVDTQQVIDFSAPGIGKQTKAPISGTVYPTTVTFGVFSYMLTGGKTWPADKATAVVVMNNVEVSYQDPVWKATSGGPYYWPGDAGSSLSFVCYSPKSAADVSYSIANSDGLTVTGYVNNGATDLMYSTEIANQKSGTVSPVFNHALTQIHFTAKTAAQYQDAIVTIKSVKLNNIISKGTFTANPGTTADWTLDNAATATFTAYDNGTGQVVNQVEAAVGDSLVMIPQADLASPVQTVTIVYDLTGQGVAAETVTKTLTLSGVWARNASIKYLITISLTEIVFSPTIVAWSTESSGTLN